MTKDERIEALKAAHKRVLEMEAEKRRSCEWYRDECLSINCDKCTLKGINKKVNRQKKKRRRAS